jgi:hypothetical protein
MEAREDLLRVVSCGCKMNASRQLCNHVIGGELSLSHRTEPASGPSVAPDDLKGLILCELTRRARKATKAHPNQSQVIDTQVIKKMIVDFKNANGVFYAHLGRSVSMRERVHFKCQLKLDEP